jgi:Carboxypeptidase regulatory-like domain
MISRRSLTLMAAMMALGFVHAACGGGDETLNENLVVEPVTPMGSVGGQILDATDDRPLVNASVSIVTGDFSVSTTTDGSGLFSVSDVPASGPVLILVNGVGALSADTTAVFTPAAGDYPMNNATLTVGPIGLEPSSGSFSLYVYDENGRPAAGHVISITTSTKWLQYNTSMPVDRGSVTEFATVGSNGLVTFTDLPDYWALGGKVNDLVTITVPPYDADLDGYYEYPGGTFTYNILALSNPQPTMVLQTDGDYPTSLAIVASNIADLEEWVSTTFVPDTIDSVGPITVLFNMPVQQDSLSVEVWSEDGNTSFGSSFTLSGRSLTIQFPTALPTALSGAEYNLLISAVAETGDRLLYGAFNAAFFVLDPANTDGVTATVVKDDASDPLNLKTIITFSEPVGFGSPGTSLNLSNSIIYFGVNNIGPNTGTGDDSGEWGFGSSHITLTPAEPTPDHPAGATLSGYNTTWTFQMPLLNGGGTMPQGIPLYLAFDQVTSSTRIVRRANGQPVPMIELFTP